MEVLRDLKRDSLCVGIRKYRVKTIPMLSLLPCVLAATSFSMLMAVAAGEKLSLEHFDVKNAFTQSDIDAEIYTEPPKGFETKGADGHPQVLKLLK